MDTSLKKLAEESWGVYRQFLDAKYVLHPSIPIMYFGDYKKYLNSDTKIVTVGLNPSKIEFPEESVFSRFPGAKIQYEEFLHGKNYEEYLNTLNNYFYDDPYTRWFDNYEQALSGFNCSFYGKKVNTALHTDLFSPLATNPTWGKLSAIQKRSLSHTGIPSWHELVRFLSPDIILVSMGAKNFQKIEFERKKSKTVSIPTRKGEYCLFVDIIELQPNKKSYLVMGEMVNVPFGKISHAEKNLIGPAILDQISP